MPNLHIYIWRGKFQILVHGANCDKSPKKPSGVDTWLEVLQKVFRQCGFIQYIPAPKVIALRANPQNYTKSKLY